MAYGESPGFVKRILIKMVIVFFGINVLFFLLFGHNYSDLISPRFWETRFYDVTDYLIKLVAGIIESVSKG